MPGRGIFPFGGVLVPSVSVVVAAILVPSLVAAILVPSLASSTAYSQPAPQAGTHVTPQCGGGLASESKLQGEIDRCDYSNYQLFMCSFRVCFYIAVCQLKY